MVKLINIYNKNNSNTIILSIYIRIQKALIQGSNNDSTHK